MIARNKMVDPFRKHFTHLFFTEGTLSQPGGGVPVIISLQVPAGIQTLVYQTQQLDTL